MTLKFALISASRSEYGVVLIKRLLEAGLRPEYVLIESDDLPALAASACFFDTRRLPSANQKPEHWNFDSDDPLSIAACCAASQVPFLTVADGGGRKAREILAAPQVDVLLTAECIPRGPILYMPRYCVLNVHPAPLPQYRGSSGLWRALNEGEPLQVSAHVVTPWLNEGPVLRTKALSLSRDDTADEILRRAREGAAELAVVTLLQIDKEGFTPRVQRLWEGQTYLEALEAELKERFRDRLAKGEYGFCAS
jgi:methionyl-tRNA formyltransferase